MRVSGIFVGSSMSLGALSAEVGNLYFNYICICIDILTKVEISLFSNTRQGMIDNKTCGCLSNNVESSIVLPREEPFHPQIHYLVSSGCS